MFGEDDDVRMMMYRCSVRMMMMFGEDDDVR